jgi:hypothetical protein
VSDPGACATCRHARAIVSARGSTFVRCGRSDADSRYPRYPRLPLLRCAGFEERGGAPGAAGGRPRPAEATGDGPAGD